MSHVPDPWIPPSTFLPGFPPLPRASPRLRVLPASRLLPRPGASRAHTPLNVLFVSQRDSVYPRPYPRLSEHGRSRIQTGSGPCAARASSPVRAGCGLGRGLREPSGVAPPLPAVSPVLPASQALSPRLQSEFVRFKGQGKLRAPYWKHVTAAHCGGDGRSPVPSRKALGDQGSPARRSHGPGCRAGVQGPLAGGAWTAQQPVCVSRSFCLPPSVFGTGREELFKGPRSRPERLASGSRKSREAERA